MRRRLSLSVLTALLLALPACGEDGEDAPIDAGASDAGARDAGASDAGASDAGAPSDAGADGGAPSDAGPTDAGPTDAGPGDAGPTDAGPTDAGPADGGPADAGTDAGMPDAGPRTYDVRVRADGACSELFFEPDSIAVPAGTSFTVRWINATGCTEIDVDMGGTVPIVLGLEPGNSYHDTIRMWCGSYTGTYVFRAYYAPDYPAYLDVDCSG